jgi:hypothetical protein
MVWPPFDPFFVISADAVVSSLAVTSWKARAGNDDDAEINVADFSQNHAGGERKRTL